MNRHEDDRNRRVFRQEIANALLSVFRFFSSQENGALPSNLRFKTILRHQFLAIGIILRHAGSGDGFALFNLPGDFRIQGEELDEQILLGAETVGGEDRTSGARASACASSSDVDQCKINDKHILTYDMFLT